MPQRSKEKKILSMFTDLKMASNQMMSQRYKSAKILLQKVLSNEPRSSNALLCYSIVIEKQCPQKSAALRQQAYLNNSSYYEYLQNDTEKIIKDIQQNIQSSMNNIKDISQLTGSQWVRLIDMYLKQRDFDTANIFVNYFDKMQNNKSYCTDQNWSNIGVKCFELGRYKQSIKFHEIAVQICPTDILYHNNLATLYYAIGQYNKSIHSLQRTLELDPNRYKSYYLNSFIRCKNGQKQQALRQVKVAVQHEPTQLFYRIKLIIVMLLHFPDKLSQIKQHMNKSLEIIQSGKFTKYYLFAKEDFPEFVKFISENFNNLQLHLNQKWRRYLELFDNFLLFGLRDKLKIKKQMIALSGQIILSNILNSGISKQKQK